MATTNFKQGKNKLLIQVVYFNVNYVSANNRECKREELLMVFL
nr:unnamed protein product [Callosobruchus analis]